MPIRIVVPELGESIVEATVARWLKREGDHVAVGEAVAELETDKVNLEVGAERTGVLVRIERKEGEDVKVGDVLGVIEEAPVEVSGAPKLHDAISSATKEAEAPPQEPMQRNPCPPPSGRSAKSACVCPAAGRPSPAAS